MLAIPIHPADLLVMRGRHVFNADYPCGTGIEGAGCVIGHGAGVHHPSIGQRVALPFGGTWSEQVTLPAASVIPLPDGVDLHQGAMVALNPVTLGTMGMKPGQWPLHNAANSSLARLITRVAADKGIHSISVVRRAGMEAELKAIGADHVLVDGEDLPERDRPSLEEGVDRASTRLAQRLEGCLTPSLILHLNCYGLLGATRSSFLPRSLSSGMFRCGATHGCAIFAHCRERMQNVCMLTSLLALKKDSFTLRFWKHSPSKMSFRLWSSPRAALVRARCCSFLREKAPKEFDR